MSAGVAADFPKNLQSPHMSFSSPRKTTSHSRPSRHTMCTCKSTCGCGCRKTSAALTVPGLSFMDRQSTKSINRYVIDENLNIIMNDSPAPSCSFDDSNSRMENREDPERVSTGTHQKVSIAQKIEQVLKRKSMDRVPFERVSVQIEVGKLRKLLTESINIITFAMCLPQLVENDYALLRKRAPPEFVEDVKGHLESVNFKTCSLFSANEYEFRRTNFFTESSASTVEKFYSEYREKPRDFSGKKEMEDVWAAVTLVYERSKEDGQLFTKAMKAKIPEHIKELLDTLEKLFDHILEEMEKSPKDVEHREIELSRMFMSFEQQNNEMVTLHSLLRPSIEQNLLKIMDVCQQVQSLKDQKRKLKEFLTNSHQRIRNNLEKNTMMYNLEAMKTTKEKMGPRKELMNKHDKLMKEDLAEEKAFRVKKYKVEQVLQDVMNKYERDMNNRNAKLTHLNEMYEMEMAQMNRMQERYDAQEVVYNLLMEEKAKYEQAVWEAKLREIQRNIAARKIQRFYRGYLSFMQAHGKRKGKGKSKGKKRS